jgi:hypothetical protein
MLFFLSSLPWHAFIKVLHWFFGGIALVVSFSSLIMIPLLGMFTSPDNGAVSIGFGLFGSACWFAIYCGIAWLHRWGIGVWPFPMTYFIRLKRKVIS